MPKMDTKEHKLINTLCTYKREKKFQPVYDCYKCNLFKTTVKRRKNNKFEKKLRKFSCDQIYSCKKQQFVKSLLYFFQLG